MAKVQEPDVQKVVFNFWNDATCVLPDGIHTKHVSDAGYVIHWHGLNYVTISPKPKRVPSKLVEGEFEESFDDRGNWQLCVPTANIRTILLKPEAK